MFVCLFVCFPSKKLDFKKAYWVSQEIQALLYQCSDARPDFRPSSTELLRAFNRILCEFPIRNFQVDTKKLDGKLAQYIKQRQGTSVDKLKHAWATRDGIKEVLQVRQSAYLTVKFIICPPANKPNWLAKFILNANDQLAAIGYLQINERLLLWSDLGVVTIRTLKLANSLAVIDVAGQPNQYSRQIEASPDRINAVRS